MKKKKTLLLCLSAFMAVSICGCGIGKQYTPVSGLDQSKNVSLKIAIPYETNKALNTVSNAFMEKYPNVAIQLEYVEDYDQNALQLFKQNKIDMILQKDIFYTEYTEKNQETGEETKLGDTTDDYFYNFVDEQEIDFSDTTPDIADNYRHTRVDEGGNEITYEYTYPLGGETRGVFVNKTLLKQYGLETPTNYTEFLNCCEVLKQNGLIPIQGGGDTASYGLGLAAAANEITHDEAALEDMRLANPGITDHFKDVLEKMYTLATNRYFDYKAVEAQGYFSMTNELAQSESFLGIRYDADTLEAIKPENNCGYAAFLPYISSTETVINSLIEEYNLDTEVEFICSPLNDEGSKSPAYITPYYGICANKNSENLVWIREFINFLFQEKNNKIYAENANIIPNTKDALQYVAKQYNLDEKKDISLCGQIRFSDEYNGFTPITNALKNTFKCEAQKYMMNLNKDANGNIQFETDDAGKKFLYLGDDETTVGEQYIGEEDKDMPGFAFCSLQYFIDNSEKDFATYRTE